MIELSKTNGAFLVALVYLNGGEALPQVFRSVSKGDQIVDMEELDRRVPRYARDTFEMKHIILAKWPGKAEMERLIPPRADVPQSGRAECATWLRRVVKKEWMPPDIGWWLIPMREFIQKDDYFCARYAVGNVKIQILIGPTFQMLIADPALHTAENLKPQSPDLGARRYLNVPKGSVVEQNEKAIPLAPGVWEGLLGSRVPRGGRPTWDETCRCVKWESYLWIGAERWHSSVGNRLIWVNTRVGFAPNDPDFVQWGATKHYVMFRRHPKWGAIGGVSLVLIAALGLLFYFKRPRLNANQVGTRQ